MAAHAGSELSGSSQYAYSAPVGCNCMPFLVHTTSSHLAGKRKALRWGFSNIHAFKKRFRNQIYLYDSFSLRGLERSSD